ncbi:SDR family NAD(P)-dependent oxidoreductase, partial [Mycolicibacter minnesotensis]
HSIIETADAATGEPVTVASTLRKGDDETLSFHLQLAELGRYDTGAAAGGFVELPQTPWQHRLHWISLPETAGVAADVHPLLGAHVEMLSGTDHIWQHTLDTAALPWLAAHPVHGQAVLPVAALIEMVLAAGSQGLGRPAEALAVTGLQVEQPLPLDGPMQVTTTVSTADGQPRVEIHARADGEAWSRYAVAHLEPAPTQQAPTPPPAGDVHPLSEAADRLPHPAYRLDPVALDAALRQLAAATDDPSGYAPAAVAAVHVFGPAGHRPGCHTELTGDAENLVGRVVLTDEAGGVAAEITGVELRRIDPRSLRVPLDQKLFGTEWVLSPAPAATPAADGSWLVLAEPSAAELAAQFGAQLAGPGRVVVAGTLADEPALTDAVARTAADPAHPPVGMVVFLDRPGFDGTDPEAAVARARELVWTVSSAARAAVAGWPAASGAPRPRLWLVSRGGLAFGDDQPGDPAIGALKGVVRTWRFPGELARVLADEPDLAATLVDFDGDDTAALTAAVLAELAAPLRDDVIAWRGGQRYTERITRVALDGAGTAAADPHDTVRPDGAYLLTGGLGGLGTVVARWLAARGAGRLVLNGRSEPSAEQRAVLDELATETEVVFVAGDISAPAVAEALVAAAEQTGLPLRGVVHAAGVLGEGLVTAVSPESLHSVWSAKAVGAARLHAALQEAGTGRRLDWWVGFSSMAALLGLPGQLGYATSNAWLDALMAWRHANGLPATAVDWGQWSDVGLGRSVSLSVLDPISPDEGIEALEAVLALEGGPAGGRVGVGRLRIDRAVATSPEFGDLTFFEDLVAEAQVRPDGTAEQSGGAAPGPAGAPDWSTIPADRRREELVVRLQAILARELRTSASAVDVDQPFPEMGLDSMIAMTVLKETQQLVGVDLSASMLWNHPSISALTTHLVGLLAAHHAVPDDTEQDEDDLGFGSSGGVLDELFDQVESASTGSESGIY